MNDYNGNDIYCDLLIPGKVNLEIVKETDKLLAFYHTKPFWPVHIVVTPKQHVPSILELEDDLAKELLVVIKEIARDVAEKTGGCRIQTHLGENQDSKHLHFHINSGDPKS